MPYSRRERVRVLTAIFGAGLLSLSFGCTDKDNPLSKALSAKDPVDQQLDLSKDDYRHMAVPKDGKDPKIEYQNHPPPVPDIVPILTAPSPPKIAGNQLVSIAVTDDVPLKDVLMELAKLADVDMELDAGIEGGISFIARNKPFNEVIDRICDLAGLRYTMKGSVLRVERDIPYVKTYSLDFLNMDRSMTSTVNVSTNVLSSDTSGGSSAASGGASGGSSAAGSGGGGGGLNTGSTSSVTAKMDGDFWKSLENGVKGILTYNPPKRVSEISDLMEGKDVISAVTGQSQVRTVAGAPPGVPGAPGAPGGGAVGGAGALASSNQGSSQRILPTPPPSKPAPTNSVSVSGTAQSGNGMDNTFYIINRQAGVLTASATEKQHDMIRRFLDKIESNASSQVLIEAKILEVQLNNTYKTGIDWTQMKNKLGFTFAPNSVSSTDSNVVSFIIDKQPFTQQTGLGPVPSAVPNGIGELVQLTENFGTVRTLSSPRLHAINNQTATLTFAENDVYFSLQIQQNTTATTSTTTQTTVQSTAHTVPIGIIMSIQPSINLDTDEVTLNVRPTLSSLVGSVDDPAVAYLSQTAHVNLSSTVPIVQVRELDSILKLKSGQIMVIGGLMQQGSTNTDAGVPGVSSIPIVGNLFKGVSKEASNSELIIFIKATIVGSNGNSAPADRVIYNKFSDDPRPMTF